MYLHHKFLKCEINVKMYSSEICWSRLSHVTSNNVMYYTDSWYIGITIVSDMIAIALLILCYVETESFEIMQDLSGF